MKFCHFLSTRNLDIVCVLRKSLNGDIQIKSKHKIPHFNHLFCSDSIVVSKLKIVQMRIHVPAIKNQPSLTVSIFGHCQRIYNCWFSVTHDTHPFSIKFLISPVTNSGSSLADLLLLIYLTGFVFNEILNPNFMKSNIVLPVPILFIVT